MLAEGIALTVWLKLNLDCVYVRVLVHASMCVFEIKPFLDTVFSFWMSLMRVSLLHTVYMGRSCWLLKYMWSLKTGDPWWWWCLSQQQLCWCFWVLYQHLCGRLQCSIWVIVRWEWLFCAIESLLQKHCKNWAEVGGVVHACGFMYMEIQRLVS